MLGESSGVGRNMISIKAHTFDILALATLNDGRCVVVSCCHLGAESETNESHTCTVSSVVVVYPTGTETIPRFGRSEPQNERYHSKRGESLLVTIDC